MHTSTLTAQEFLAAFGGARRSLFNPPAIDPARAAALDIERFAVALHGVAQRIDRADAGAAAALARLLAELKAHPDPRCTGLVVFGAAMARRLHTQGCEATNLYLRQFDVPQIQLFNLLGRAVPFASMATAVCNQAIADAIAGQAHPTLIDVGMGTGRQFGLLLDELARRGQLPQALTVIGIEPMAWALDDARRQLTEQAARLGLPLRFHGVAASAEALDENAWAAVAAHCTGAPVVNASFALHHIADNARGDDQRNPLLRRLRALNPALLVLAEPDVDHLEPRFFRRFQNCFAHFNAVFRTLDQLPLAQADRDALKVGFFGREIEDILAMPEDQRSERHECAASWLQRLAATGFVAQPERLPGIRQPHAAVRVAHRGQHLALQAGHEPVVSIILAGPAAARG